MLDLMSSEPWSRTNSFMLDIMISGIRQFSGFSPGTLVSSTNYSECHNIAEILLNVTLVLDELFLLYFTSSVLRQNSLHAWLQTFISSYLNTRLIIIKKFYYSIIIRIISSGNYRGCNNKEKHMSDKSKICHVTV
jgi:hypothetical protein